MAQVMGFPRSDFWQTVPPIEGLSLLGNAISPMHAARTLGRLWMHLEAINHRQALNRILAIVSDLAARADARGPRTHPPAPTPQGITLPGAVVLNDPLPPQPTPAPGPIILSREGAPCILGPEIRRRTTPQPSGDEAGATPRGVNAPPHPGGDQHMVLWIRLPNGTTTVMGTRTSCTGGQVVEALQILGHTRGEEGILAIAGRPIPTSTTLATAGLHNNSHISFRPTARRDIRQVEPREDYLRGGLQRSQRPVTRLPIGTRRDVTEITLFIRTGLQGRVDIQVAPLTPIAELYQYVAAIIGVAGRYIDLTRTNTCSIADHGTVFGHVPGISHWGHLDVHRHLHLRIRVYSHTANTADEVATTELATVPVEARSDINGAHIWRRVLRHLYPQHDDFPDSLTPSFLRVVSPTRTLMDEGLSLWAHEDLPPDAVHVEIEAHLGESQEATLLLENHLEQNTPLTLPIEATQPWYLPKPDNMRGGALTDRGQAQGTVRPWPNER